MDELMLMDGGCTAQWGFFVVGYVFGLRDVFGAKYKA